MAGKQVVVLGGGIGGLVTAHELRRRLGRDHQVVVVDREAEHRFQASFLWVMMGWREPRAVSRPLVSLKARGIDFHQAEVRHIDLAGRRVETSTGTLDYDFLVVALGAELAEDAIPELAAGGHTPYTLEGATRLREAWQGLEGGSVAVVIASLPFKCPAAPYEAALLLDSGFRKRGIRSNVELHIFTPEGQPMPVAGAAVGQALKGMLEQRGIGYSPNTRLTSVAPQERTLAFDDSRRLNYDLLVYVPAHRSPAAVRASGLAGEAGWIPVDGRTLETGHEGVFAIGDVTALKLSNGMMLPKAGVFAHYEGEVVAHNIAARIKGGTKARNFDGWGGCFIEAGDGKAAYGSGNFLAEPVPAVQLHMASRSRHLSKVLFEKGWLLSLSPSPAIAGAASRALHFGSKTLLEQRWLWRWL